MIDLSIIVPTIRPHLLTKFYDSILKSCKAHTFEVIFVSPYFIPEDLLKKGNVKYIHSYANPSVCFQIAAMYATSKYIYNNTDDGVHQEDAIDKALDFIKENNLQRRDIINMQYIEGVLSPDTLLPIIDNPKPYALSYWEAKTYPDFYLPQIDINWKLAPQFLMETDIFRLMGGLNCSIEYLNFNLHDIVFRLQDMGGKVYNSPSIAFLCSHLPGRTGDHSPIDIANDFDKIKFRKIYSDEQRCNIISYDNWKDEEVVWSRRFDKNNLKTNP